MPFGLTNASSTFQLLMQSVLRGLEHLCLPYIDDVIIYSVTFDEHLSHISPVLSRLDHVGLTVKASKCPWCFQSFDFLGFYVGKGKLSIPEVKVAHIRNFIIPSTKSDLKSFLGLFIQDLYPLWPIILLFYLFTFDIVALTLYRRLHYKF